MTDLNIPIIAIVTIGSFILSGIWYAALSGTSGKLHKAYAQESKMPPWQTAVELLRSLIVTLVIAFIINKTGATELSSALLYAFIFWLAFPVVLLVGSVIHENVPVKLASIHAGDWLIKLLFITSIITIWK